MDTSGLVTNEIGQDKVKITLKEVFGYNQFRGNQEKIIRNVLDRKNSFVIMPTGAGKSLCYQLPAIIMPGTAIVISPLIALMKNQVDQMNALNINAQFLNSTLTKAEINRVRKETLDGNLKLLYVAPESLTKPDNISFLKLANISFAAIDEAHCISEWGHDFRPEYRRIRAILEEIGDVPVIALTATATPKVQLDIKKNLYIEDAEIFKSSFNRPNLYYEIRPKTQVKKQLIKFIKEHKEKSGIVYCLSRKKVEEIADFLKVNDIKAAPYHAGLDSDIRRKNQDDFLNEEIEVIVATIAFGMGIDKPDVRFVIHYDTPKSLEGYYQETGRAGRDGLEGNCILFFSYKDIIKLEKFNKDKSVTERENARILLDEMASYAESSECRRKQLLHYFGEEFNTQECGKTMWCDSCRFPVEKFDGKEFAILALEAALQTNERFGIGHLSHVLRGKDDQYVMSYKHNKLPVFGKGKNHDDIFWQNIIRTITINGYLEKDIENIGTLKVTQKGKEYLKNPTSIMVSEKHDFTSDEEDEGTDNQPMQGAAYDDTLYHILRAIRKKVAKDKGLPPYVIFQDPSLEEMATTYPTTVEELSRVNGVGRGKVDKFGAPFIEAIKDYVEENDITTARDVVIKSAGNKSKIKIYIIQQIDRKIDLEEIAESKDLTFEELLDEMEQIIYSGTKLNIDYYINEYLDEERCGEIFDYFLAAENDSIEDALDELGDEGYEEEELRLVRIKFLSEYAN
jgi:ATP-dependent DNA helicase RecQ